MEYVRLTDRELIEIRYAIDKQLEEVEYEIDEIEDTPVLQTKKMLLESAISKINLISSNTKIVRVR
ncbi:hypothetical protein [Romboutsia ilealis]|uniref:hypothetical protein n=1 Tax=Romboutsia ilealis TaxID=1115758 RepID=UPI00256FEAB7|nr:hypothetical protein [Romboutsia ilealis]